MHKKIISLCLIISSNFTHSAAFNIAQPEQQQNHYISLSNNTNGTLVINPELSIPANQRDFIEVTSGTTIQHILSGIDIGARTFQALSPVAFDTAIQNNLIITFTNNQNPEIINFSVQMPQSIIPQPLNIESSEDDSEYSSEFSDSEDFEEDEEEFTESTDDDEEEEFIEDTDDDKPITGGSAAAA